ncbi:MAG: ABC transporter substrate-binding protein [bacterium]|nr:ABC transporter substrate-binding protein [bacterium]
MEPYSPDPVKRGHIWNFFSTIKEKAQNRLKSVGFSFKIQIPEPVRVWFVQIVGIIKSFSPREKIMFFLIAVVCVISALGLLWNVSSFFMVEIPERGGSLTEGVIGTPRFINPLLALSDADRDLTQLVYSGLLRARADGELIPDLAESFEISEDGLTYTFVLKKDLIWQDGKPLEADDVAFTVLRVKDPVLKSPRRASWEGVNAEEIDSRTIRFTLSQPYSPFLENAIIGILPKHAWEEISSEQFSFSNLNIEPIGSGPYKIRFVKKDSLGIPEYYDLSPFKNFALQRPYINNLRIRFYQNAEELLAALTDGDVDAANAVSPEQTETYKKAGERIVTYALPRMFGVFFNQNQNPIFVESVVREALSLSVNREKIIQDVLYGYGTALYGPLPPGSLGFTGSVRGEEKTNEARARAEEILEKAGWKKSGETSVRQKTVKKKTQVLRFSLTTGETAELRRTAELLKEMWTEIGAEVEIKIFKSSDLNQNIIRPRKYDALFFGEIVGRESDPFAFWHSSQRNDPGLNIALYTNITTDKLLEEGRTTPLKEKRIEIYKKFEKEIIEDTPLVTIYSPDFIYIVPQKIQGMSVGTITTPSERFLDVYSWYINTVRVWKMFSEKQEIK